MSITIELIGGIKDGTLLAVPDGTMPKILRLPVGPTLLESMELYKHPHASLELPAPLIYEWDGTVREDGVRRFRLR